MNTKLESYSMANQLKWRSMHLPDNLALCYLADGETETQRLTYRELDAYATRIAAILQSQNLKNKPALLLYSSGLEFAKAFFGCLYAGVIAVPTYVPKSQQILQKIESIQQDCQAEIILTTQDILEEDYLKTSKLSELFILTTDVISQNQIEVYYESPTLPEDIVFIQYTSGSTSQPKGAMVSNRNIMVNQVMLQHVFELNEKSVGVTWLPLFHDMGLIASLLNAIFVGYPIYIMPPSAFIRKPLRWLQCISKYKGTYTCAPNFAYDLCMRNISVEDRAGLDLSSLKKAINAAEPIQSETLQEFTKQFTPYGFREEAFTPAYGLAEATVFVTGKSDSVIKYTYLEKEAFKNNRVVYSESPINTNKMISCGLANFLGQKIKIIHPDTQQIVNNEIGEICIAGDHIVKGYLNKPDISEAIFGMNIEGINYLRTGDLGFIDKGGELYITGRLKDLIIINGNNYYPQDVELTAESKNPFIRKNSIAAFSVPIDHKEQLVVVIETNNKMLADFDAQKLGSEINSAVFNANDLTAYEIIFIASGTLPKTTSGKIQRQTCKKMYLANELKTVAKWQAPHSNEEKTAANMSNFTSSLEDCKLKIINCICAFIAKTLKIDVESVRATSKFLDFNMDSIQLATLSVELEKIINLPISEKIFYDYITIQDIANALVTLPVQQSPEQIIKNLHQLQSRHVNINKKIAIPKFAEKTHRKIN